MTKRGNPQDVRPTDNELEILKSVYWEPRIGLRIFRDIVEQTNNEVLLPPASLYTSLKRMHGLGWLEMLPEEEDGRKLYLATELGRRKVDETSEWMQRQICQIKILQQGASRSNTGNCPVLPHPPAPVPGRPVGEEERSRKTRPLVPRGQT